MPATVLAPPAWRVWWTAARPVTLLLTATPVLVGTALAATHSLPLWNAVLLVAVSALAIQIGTNLMNDAADCERGADRPDRLGPPRVCALGWRSPAVVRNAALIAFGLAAVSGSMLVVERGAALAVIGVASIAAGLAYSIGPRPIAYSALGEGWVVLFFGPVAVVGTQYAVGPVASPLWPAFAAGLMCGSIAAAVLALNNLRDIASDRRAGRRTFAVRYGEHAARAFVAGLILAPFGLLALAVALRQLPPGALAPLLLLQTGWRLAGRVRREPIGRGMNPLLAQTTKLAAGFGALLSIGALI